MGIVGPYKRVGTGGEEAQRSVTELFPEAPHLPGIAAIFTAHREADGNFAGPLPGVRYG